MSTAIATPYHPTEEDFLNAIQAVRLMLIHEWRTAPKTPAEQPADEPDTEVELAAA